MHASNSHKNSKENSPTKLSNHTLYQFRPLGFLFSIFFYLQYVWHSLSTDVIHFLQCNFRFTLCSLHGMASSKRSILLQPSAQSLESSCRLAGKQAGRQRQAGRGRQARHSTGKRIPSHSLTRHLSAIIVAHKFKIRHPQNDSFVHVLFGVSVAHSNSIKKQKKDEIRK